MSSQEAVQHLTYDDYDADIIDELNVLALPRPPSVEGEDLSLPPMDGIQFIRRVIKETKKCEPVTTVEMNFPPQTNVSVIKIPTKRECNKELLPTKDYQQSVVADFSKLRLKMEYLRKRTKHDGAFRTFKKTLPNEEENEEWLKICSQNGPDVVKECEETAKGPSTRLCLAMSQCTNMHVLSYFPDWLTEGLLSVVDSCRWIYGMLACLELPLEPDMYFTLRQIARALLELRAGLESQDSEPLPHINLIVCIIGRYFGQEDLADPYI
uniref:Gem-associated protein 2 n=1 Tax=Graphocephala atropunctata TaxID=36148 RepID=A0A1B6M3D1_9HEMI